MSKAGLLLLLLLFAQTLCLGNGTLADAKMQGKQLAVHKPLWKHGDNGEASSVNQKAGGALLVANLAQSLFVVQRR